MIVQELPIEKLIKNPNNPRVIKDAKFKKLVKSLQEFPEMLKIRPIVTNKDMVILGGNQRYEAMKAAGMKKAPVIVADNLTEEQQREFIIKDNVGYGEWDWEILANEWDETLLNVWGLDVNSTNYEPNKNPDIGYDSLTSADIQKEANRLKNEMLKNSGNLIKTICPNCGHEYYVS